MNSHNRTLQKLNEASSTTQQKKEILHDIPTLLKQISDLNRELHHTKTALSQQWELHRKMLTELNMQERMIQQLTKDNEELAQIIQRHLPHFSPPSPPSTPKQTSKPFSPSA